MSVRGALHAIALAAVLGLVCPRSYAAESLELHDAGLVEALDLLADRYPEVDYVVAGDAGVTRSGTYSGRNRDCLIASVLTAFQTRWVVFDDLWIVEANPNRMMPSLRVWIARSLPEDSEERRIIEKGGEMQEIGDAMLVELRAVLAALPPRPADFEGEFYPVGTEVGPDDERYGRLRGQVVSYLLALCGEYQPSVESGPADGLSVGERDGILRALRGEERVAELGTVENQRELRGRYEDGIRRFGIGYILDAGLDWAPTLGGPVSVRGCGTVGDILGPLLAPRGVALEVDEPVGARTLTVRADDCDVVLLVKGCAAAIGAGGEHVASTDLLRLSALRPAAYHAWGLSGPASLSPLGDASPFGIAYGLSDAEIASLAKRDADLSEWPALASVVGYCTHGAGASAAGVDHLLTDGRAVRLLYRVAADGSSVVDCHLGTYHYRMWTVDGPRDLAAPLDSPAYAEAIADLVSRALADRSAIPMLRSGRGWRWAEDAQAAPPRGEVLPCAPPP